MKNERKDMKGVKTMQKVLQNPLVGFHVFHGVFAYKKRFSASVSSLFHATSFDSFRWQHQVRKNCSIFFAATTHEHENGSGTQLDGSGGHGGHVGNPHRPLCRARQSLSPNLDHEEHQP